MKQLPKFILLTILMAMILGSGTQERVPQGLFTDETVSPSECIKLELKLDKATYRNNDSVEIMAVLRSFCNRILVNKRMMLSNHAFGEISLWVMSPSGEKKFLPYYGEFGSAGDEDFMMLNLDESISRKYRWAVWRFGRFDEEGEYKVQIIYQNEDEPNNDCLWQNNQVWKGTAISNEVTVTVQP